MPGTAPRSVRCQNVHAEAEPERAPAGPPGYGAARVHGNPPREARLFNFRAGARYKRLYVLQEANVRLGIDFGTTRTVVAGCLDGRYPVASFDIGGTYRDYVPGLAAVVDGRLCFGWDAVAVLDRTGARAGADVTGTRPTAVRSIKRLVGALAPDDLVPGLELPVTALELATGFLAHVRGLVTERSNLDVAGQALEVEVAVPAHASTRQRYLTLEAFTQAGFHVVGMRNEPTAAAIELACRNRTMLSARSPKRYVVVYDLGGGTFDTSAVSLEGRRFEVLATAGLPRLGGDDFDEAIAELVLAELGPAAAALDETAHVALRELCREAKESLTPHSRRLMIDVSAQVPGTAPVILPVSAIYERCEPLAAQTLACVREVFAALAAHGLTPEDTRELGGLYLVGGAVAFPAVGRILRAEYGRKIQLAPQPHAATAVGLAACADVDAQLLVREAVSRHFGVWREAADGREKVFDPILSKNGAVDAASGGLVVHRSYRPTHTVGRLRFLECNALNDNGQPTGELTPWTEIAFPYDPRLALARDLSRLPVERCAGLLDEEIAETYTYGADGTIAVEIENRTRGYRRRFVLGTLR
jgi:molecular chaperone DnaK